MTDGIKDAVARSRDLARGRAEVSGNPLKSRTRTPESADIAESFLARHCERSEAIQSRIKTPWIASLRSQ